MALTRMREKGQITIPASIRKSLKLGEDVMLSVAKAGDAIVISRRPSRFESIAREFSSQAEKSGVRLDDLLKALRKKRRA